MILEFAAEGFGLERLRQITMEDIEKRVKEMKEICKF